MATIAIGDIHGNRPALDDLLTRIQSEVQAGDTVVFLGDYIDRGPDSRGCIDRILQYKASSPAAVVTLTGNHEDWLLRTFEDPTHHSWLIGMKGLTTVESYSQAAAAAIGRAADVLGPMLIIETHALPYDQFLNALPPAHLEFLKDLRVHHRADGAIFVHGGVDPSLAFEDQRTQDLIWGTAKFLTHYSGPDTVVYGHWDNARVDGEGWPHPAMDEHTIGIDTISHGVLSAVRLPDRQVFQSARYPTGD